MSELSSNIPTGTRSRLSEHYGNIVSDWLDNAERLVTDAASLWNVRLAGFYDSGWTSVVGFGYDSDERPVVLKALPDAERFTLERAALTHWGGEGVCRLRAADDHGQVLMINSVGEQVGGHRRPDDHLRRVAAAIPMLHRTAASPGPVPLLTDYYRNAVMPRIERRARVFAHVVGADPINRVLSVCDELISSSSTMAMLHSDLYAENVLFSQWQDAVFIDPHAKVGSPAFDWAFWSVYYVPRAGFADRLALCREQVPELFDEVLAWCASLAVDGALYYLEANDSTAVVMIENLRTPLLAPLVDRRLIT